MPEEAKRKTLCPECGTEVEVTRDDEGDDQGRCPKCKLDVGRILTRRRYRNAEEKLDAQEKAEREKSEKKNKKKWFEE